MAWMDPIFDEDELLAQQQLCPNDHDARVAFYVDTRITQLMESGQVELEPLTYIRGRSIPNLFMIVDESQNLTPTRSKTSLPAASATARSWC